MRRNDRLVTEPEEICQILDACSVCHLAMNEENFPYIIPLSFGYELKNGILTLYFHGAKEGHKLDLIRNDSRVSFAISNAGETVTVPENACRSTTFFCSVCGRGEAEILEEPAEKCRALSLLMEHQGMPGVVFQEAQAESVCVFKVTSDSFQGKCKKKPQK